MTNEEGIDRLFNDIIVQARRVPEEKVLSNRRLLSGNLVAALTELRDAVKFIKSVELSTRQELGRLNMEEIYNSIVDEQVEKAIERRRVG